MFPGYRGDVIACRIFGHRYRFRADDATMHWECTRGCGAQGEKRYETAEDASRYARGLERAGERGSGMPLVSTLPLRVLERMRRSRGAP